MTAQVDAVMANIRTRTAAMAAAASAGLAEAGQQISDTTAANTPVEDVQHHPNREPGTARRSWHVEEVGPGHVAVKSDDYVTVFGEFGTIHESPRPALRPALHQAEATLTVGIAEFVTRTGRTP